MKMMLDWHGISRQGAHQGIIRLHKARRDILDTVELATGVRKEHPQMGCRDMYYAVREQMPRGRDWTEQLLLNCGYRVKTPPRSFTVAGQGVRANLIEGMSITGPNQVWQTDITYVWCGQRWYYVSFVIDVYTRQILGSHCSRDLSGASQVCCLRKAIDRQTGNDLSSLIIHTDRGVQYTSGEYNRYLLQQGIKHSMAHYAWQNAYCERVNRTIKENYLAHYSAKCYRSLQAGVTKAVNLYNTSKPHRGLPSRMSPSQFAKDLTQGGHPEYRVHIWSKLTSTKMLYVK